MDNKVFGCIYRIRNKINNNCYVGKTINLDRRLKYHFQADEDTLLCRAIRKYKKDSFICEILYNNIEQWMLNDLEIRTIASLNTFLGDGYNMTPGGDGMLGGLFNPNRRKDLVKNLDNIVLDYENRMSIEDIGEKYKANFTVIRNYLILAGVEIRKQGINLKHGNTRYDIQSNLKEIVNLYNQGLSTQNIADKYDCSNRTIIRILILSGIEIRSRSEALFKSSKRKDVWNKSEEIIEMYKSRKSCRSISIQMKCSESLIKKILLRNNVELRSKKK